MVSETKTHIVCHFLSQVGFCDKDFGDFLTGPVQHASDQRVFIILQSCPFYQISTKENKLLTNKNKYLYLQNHSNYRLTSRLMYHIKDKVFRVVFNLKQNK